MGYLGTPPQSGFITTAKQRVTSSTNNYVDLDHAISSIADVIVFVNFVKQDTTKDRLDQRWTLTLTGSQYGLTDLGHIGNADAESGSGLVLTNYTASLYENTSTVGGYYKVISGSAGVPYDLNDATYGKTTYGYLFLQIVR